MWTRMQLEKLDKLEKAVIKTYDDFVAKHVYNIMDHDGFIDGVKTEFKTVRDSEILRGN